MNNKKIVKYFGKKEVKFIDKDDQLWLTAEQIGICLGYKDPRRDILKIYRRNQDILEYFKGVVNLPTPGGKQSVTIFNELGCNIIAMKSTTRYAKEFVVWAAHIIRDYRHGHLVKKDERKKLPPASFLAELRKLNPDNLTTTLWLRDNIGIKTSPTAIIKTAFIQMGIISPSQIAKQFGYTSLIQFFIDINKGTFKEKDRLAAVLGLTAQDIWPEGER